MSEAVVDLERDANDGSLIEGNSDYVYVAIAIDVGRSAAVPIGLGKTDNIGRSVYKAA